MSVRTDPTVPPSPTPSTVYRRPADPNLLTVPPRRRRSTSSALVAAAPLLLALALLFPAPNPVHAQDTFTLGGDRVAVFNLAGAVEVVRGSGSEVQVEVRPGGSDASRLSVEVGRIRGLSTLVVRYPDDRIVYAPAGAGRYRTQVRVRDDGTFGGSGGGGGRVRISSGGSGLEAWADLRIQVPEGVAIEVHNAVGRALVQGVAAEVALDLNSGPVTVRDLVGGLSVDTGSGSVDVVGLEGELTVDTGSGQVTMERIRGPLAWVDSGSGSVEGRAVDADRIEVDTGSGSVELVDVRTGEILVDTGSGAVTLDFLTPPEDVVVDTGSGAVRLFVPEGLDAEIQVETGSGGIDVDLPLVERMARRRSFRGLAGSGMGRIFIDTGSGGVQIRAR